MSFASKSTHNTNLAQVSLILRKFTDKMVHFSISVWGAGRIIQYTINDGRSLAGANAQCCANPHYLHTCGKDKFLLIDKLCSSTTSNGA